jgi:hypothetical protein
MYIVYWFGECFFFTSVSVVAIVCFILVIIEATYIVYWFGEWFFFAGFLVAACCCFARNSTCASAFHHFRVSLDAIVSFCIPCLLFSVCSLQVRMFVFLFCLGCSFVIVGDTYVVHWLGGSCWFMGCWFCLFGWGLCFGALGVQFGLFVLSRWFGPCWCLLFGLALQGWGATTVVGAFVFSFFLDYYYFLGALYGVQPLHPPVDMQLCYFLCLLRPISVIL